MNSLSLILRAISIPNPLTVLVAINSVAISSLSGVVLFPVAACLLRLNDLGVLLRAISIHHPVPVPATGGSETSSAINRVIVLLLTTNLLRLNDLIMLLRTTISILNPYPLMAATRTDLVPSVNGALFSLPATSSSGII